MPLQKLTLQEIYYLANNPEEVKVKLDALVDKVNSLDTTVSDKANVAVVAGVGAESTIALTATSIIAVLAVTTATGAVATKTLLAETVDYTFNANVLTCVTDQSAATLTVVYK